MDMAWQLPKVIFTNPGRDLGEVLGLEFKEAVRIAGLGREVSWDWDGGIARVDIEVDAVEAEQEVERQNVDVEQSVELSRQGSRIEERRGSSVGPQVLDQGSKLEEGSFLGLPQAESSRIVPADQGKDVHTALGDIVEEEDVVAEVIREELLPPVNNLDHTPVVPEEELCQDVWQQAENIKQLFDEQDDLANNIHNIQLDDINEYQQPSTANLPYVPSISQATVLAKVSQLTEYGSGFCYFSSICPPSSTSRIDAAITFFHLLQMEKETVLVSSQEEVFKDIKYKMSAN